MEFLSKLFKTKLPVVQNKNIVEFFQIPEPTKSLIFITNEDPSKAQNAFNITLKITLTTTGVKRDTSDGKNIYGEPSVIWTKLPVSKNEKLEDKPMYSPSYYHLSPEHRYQYLMWLQDVTKPTNLSYVFLYYYGLERHLLFGEFEFAFNEIVRLLEYHDRGTFRSYAEKALVVASLAKERFDLIEKFDFLYDGVTNQELLLKKYLGINLSAKDVILLSNAVGFKNKRYIKLFPEEFEQELDKVLIDYEAKNGRILESVDISCLKNDDSTVFANYSLKDSVRRIPVPNLIENENFLNTCRILLEESHNRLKAIRKIK